MNLAHVALVLPADLLHRGSGDALSVDRNEPHGGPQLRVNGLGVAGDDQQVVGVVAVGDEALGAVDGDGAVSVVGGGGDHGVVVGTGARLGDAEGEAALAFLDLLRNEGNLLGGAELEHVGDAQSSAGAGVIALAAHVLGNEHQGDSVNAAAAVLLGDGEGADAALHELGHVLDGVTHLVVAIAEVFLIVALFLHLGDELIAALKQKLLLFGNFPIHD